MQSSRLLRIAGLPKLLLAILASGGAWPEPPADVSVGSAITNPRSITGPWEQSSGLGKAVGFDVEILTKASGAATGSAADRHVTYLWLTTYERENGRSRRTFYGSNVTAQFSWQGDHLVLHEPALDDTKAVDLDVVFDSRAQTWRGTMQNEWFWGPVSLRRPQPSHSDFFITGNWTERSAGDAGFRCSHVALGADGALVIWSDWINPPARKPNPTNATVSPSTVTEERYGSLDIDPELKNVGSNLLFFTGTEDSGAVMLGEVAADGKTFAGSFAHFGDGYSSEPPFKPFLWRRTMADCGTL